MASPKMIAIACETACQEIENTLGIEGIPRRHRDKEVLRRNQLQWLATHVRKVDIPQHYLDAEQLARDGATKAEIVEALLGGSHG